MGCNGKIIKWAGGREPRGSSAFTHSRHENIFKSTSTFPSAQHRCLYVTAVHINTDRAINKNNYSGNCNSTFMNWGGNETDVTPDTAQHTIFKCNVHVYYDNVTLINLIFSGPK